MTLHLATGLDLPDDAVTETLGFLGVRGSGKTYGAKVLVEELAGAGLPVVVIDPLGVWFGLRSSADGKSEGLPFVILGGDRGDVPLEPESGEVIADFVIDERPQVVLDLSHFRKAAMRRFMTAFLGRLYHRNRNALHVVVDEADLFAPQRPGKDETAMLGAMEDAVRRGRARGMGMTLITQRPAVIHKDILTQVSTLLCFRMAGPQDRAAVDAWVRAHGTDAERDKLMDSLASLPTGQCWAWSPEWLDLFKRVKIRRARTFDSSATPKVGQRRVEPRARSEVDLDALRQRMASTIERAQASDPKVLRHRILELERQLVAARAAHPEPERIEVKVPVEVQVLDPEVPGLVSNLIVATDKQISALQEVKRAVEQLQRPHPPTVPLRFGSSVELQRGPKASPAPRAATPDDASNERPLGRCERALLAVLARHAEGATRKQLSLLSGYSMKSSSYGNAIGRLRSLGFISPAGQEPILITGAGSAAAGDVEDLPTGRALVDYWLANLGRAERTMLTVFLDAWPQEMDKPSLADASGYSASSSSFGNALGRLRSLGLIEGWRAADTLAQAYRD